ncbi:MAG: amidase, partial [Anaerolineales bacterium]|nr:amidase [Anaerolineales bacterium]
MIRLPTMNDADLKALEARFETINAQIQAFLPEKDRFARLRREATELEARFPNPAERPPLYGVPVGVKDIFHVAGMPTQAGSRLPADLLTGPEAECVTQLKAAGALVLGKTVTTEFAYFAPGPTRNPHHLAHTPGGSSSGSAAAVAAGLCPLALGTQTIGSILRPAAFCGVIGFKPSFGRVSGVGVIPFSTSLDHIGFFVQDVADAALAAAVLCQGWNKAEAAPGDEAAKKLPVLGVPLGPYLQKASPEGLAHFETVQQKLQQAGFELRPVEILANFEEIATAHQALAAAEAASIHREWYADFSGLISSQNCGAHRTGAAGFSGADRALPAG